MKARLLRLHTKNKEQLGTTLYFLNSKEKICLNNFNVAFVTDIMHYIFYINYYLKNYSLPQFF